MINELYPSPGPAFTDGHPLPSGEGS
jgi:hypothetical protein